MVLYVANAGISEDGYLQRSGFVQTTIEVRRGGNQTDTPGWDCTQYPTELRLLSMPESLDPGWFLTRKEHQTYSVSCTVITTLCAKQVAFAVTISGHTVLATAYCMSFITLYGDDSCEA